MSLYGDVLNKYQSSTLVHAQDNTSWEVGLSQALGMGSCPQLCGQHVSCGEALPGQELSNTGEIE